jgi:lysophospholipase L1-like esterase
MSWVRHTRRAAVYGGGGIVGAGAGMVGLLAAQARLARRSVGPPEGEPPVIDGLWDRHGRRGAAPERAGHAVIAVLGDSSAAGLGVEHADQTPGGLVALAAAAHLGEPVIVRSRAFVGAQSRDLLDQLAALPLLDDARPADVAVIMIGANDVTHRVRAGEAARHLDAALAALHAAGVTVVVGTCPDLGTVQPIRHPLRLVCRTWSRTLAARQHAVVEEAGAYAVPIAALLGPEFEANPHEMFGPDRFHPSAAGYAAAAHALIPSVIAALENGPVAAPPAAVTSPV